MKAKIIVAGLIMILSGLLLQGVAKFFYEFIDYGYSIFIIGSALFVAGVLTFFSGVMTSKEFVGNDGY